MAACSLWSTARTLLREGATLKDKLVNESMHLKSATNDTWLGDKNPTVNKDMDLTCGVLAHQVKLNLPFNKTLMVD